MQTKFRFPGSADYAFAEIVTAEGGMYDNQRELRDIDDNFLMLVADVLRRGCAFAQVAQVANQVVQESYQPSYAPPQEAQAYSPPTPAYNAPQSGYQESQYQSQPAPAGPPPGQNAPLCQLHGQPAEYKPAGTSKRTGKAYSAFWACAMGDNNCTRASNFPRL